MALLKQLPKPLEPLVQNAPDARIYVLTSGKNFAFCAFVSAAEFAQQSQTPVRVPVRRLIVLTSTTSTEFALAVSGSDPTDAYQGKFHWAYQGRLYQTVDPDLTVEDVTALINETANRRRLQLEKAHAVQAMTKQLDETKRRKPSPKT